MKIKKFLWDNFKKHTLTIILISYLFISTYTLGKIFYFKVELAVFLFFLVIISCVVMKEQSRKIYYKFLYHDDNKDKKKLSGFMSLISCIVFLLLLFLINIGEPTLARYGLLIFLLLVISSGILLFFDLGGSEYELYKKSRLVLGFGFSFLYLLTSTYAASYFMQISNMDIGDSPLLEFGLKIAYFVFFALMLLQPLSYIFFLYISNKLKFPQIMIGLSIVAITSIALFLVPRWSTNVIVLVFDWATHSEWRTFASCGGEKISYPRERYYGFNTEKYTVYFSGRNGEWGFEELQCPKGDDSDPIRIPISKSNMPKWFQS
ncbi:TPA: hypothetical protein ACG0QJ_003755 [Proteus mirabilis]|uniref:hypothetical protein n=1 Tax=Proteus mirabilis TaxID=584 RepID=UPI0018C83D4A|nr:hypothetical protein [Proteus mirabilis]HEJ9439245.1 hypothetical protein [Proteus mirabilis]HEJ9440120.1 hypothetical protein [Proteus mirabilis]HEK1719401.1 hypothetical protein [Proteus mirabilis]HEK2725521.1 hypothetical protein [Proteus mirabilis]